MADDTEEQFVEACRLAFRGVASAIRDGATPYAWNSRVRIPGHTVGGRMVQLSIEVEATETKRDPPVFTDMHFQTSRK